VIDFYVQKNANTIKEYLAKDNFVPRGYENGDNFGLYCEQYEIVRALAHNEIEISGDKILIPQNAKVVQIEYFYATKLREEILKIISDNGFDLGHRRIIIKKYESKWGSCSPKSLSFNLKLALVPRDVVEYVVVHEFSHIAEPNHSRSFWRLVGSYMSDFKRHRKWLCDNGNKLLI
jgi:hypothetical protein